MLRAPRPDDFELFWTARREGFRAYTLQTWGSWDDAQQRGFAQRDFAELPVAIIELAGEAVGYQVLERRADHWWLDEIALLESARNAGHGTALVRAIVQGAAGVPVRLSCLHVNPARHLYERLGFRVTAVEEHRVQMEWTAVPNR